MSRISIIVTSFNRKKLLTKTINSILNQTYENFELIIVDNFSDYDFFGLLESFSDKRINGFQNYNNGIISINRNFGLRKANSKFLAFCDDDDCWMPQKLETQINFIKQNNIYDKRFILYTDCLINKEKKVRDKKKNIKYLSDLIKSNPITFSTVFSTNFKNEYQFNEKSIYIAVEDYLLWFNLFLGGFKFFKISEPLTVYRDSIDSKSNKVYGLNHLRTINVLIEIIKKVYFKKPLILFILLKKIIIEFSKYVSKRLMHSVLRKRFN